MDTQRIELRILSPKKMIFKDFVSSVSSRNSVGNFDIISQHANFISLIQKQPIIIRTLDKKTVTYNFDLAIVYCNNNKVNIYTDIQLV